MTIKIIAVGKMKEPFYQAAITEYRKRLGTYADIEIVEIEESRLPDKPTRAQIERGLKSEAADMLKHVGPSDYLVVLDREGRAYSSEAWAARLDEMMTRGKSSFAFLIGSSYGLDDSLKQSAHEKITLSALTFPHQLVRVIWLEQLYRAFKILNHETYHK
ncbi:MAG: 23S rRNA (pseudouridine(1915)-N(3))-methyltransferase RlmH [Bacilli bacterium]|jgi:23S rRNA (pseudouridine1915-N3)-methyltransferase